MSETTFQLTERPFQWGGGGAIFPPMTQWGEQILGKSDGTQTNGGRTQNIRPTDKGWGGVNKYEARMEGIGENHVNNCYSPIE